MQEAGNFSFLAMKQPKCSSGMSTARDQPKPYVSCIKINGVPILPPLLDDERRQAMCELREKAIAVEHRLSLRRRQRSTLERRNNSSDSGVASSNRSTCPGVDPSKSTPLDESVLQSETLDYLSAVSSQDNSVCSVYITPSNKTSVGSQTSFVKNSIEQQLSFHLINADSDVTPTVNYSSQESRGSSLSTGLNVDCDGPQYSPSAGGEGSLQTPGVVNKACDNTSAMYLPDEVENTDKSPNSTTLTASTDLNPYLDNAENNSFESPTQDNRQQDIGDPEQANGVPVLSQSVQSLVGSEDVSQMDQEAKELSDVSTPGAQGVVTSTPYKSEIDVIHPPAPTSHTFNLVPPNICLRPTITITDWLLSSSRVSSTIQSPREDSPAETWRNSIETVSNNKSTQEFSKNYNNLESGLDLEPSKLVVEIQSAAIVVLPPQCLEISVKEQLNYSVGNQATELQGVVDEAMVTVESAQSSDLPPATLGEEAIPPLIRQHSFTVQTGPSNLLRCYVEKNGVELNTDTGIFQNRTQTEPVAKGVNKTGTREGVGRRGWDLKGAKAKWMSGSKPPTFVKPKPPASRLKKQVNTKHHTLCIPSIRSASSLPSSASNSPMRNRQAYGSADGLNYKSQTPQKRPRRSLSFVDPSPKTTTKFGDHSYAKCTNLAKVPPVTSPLKTMEGPKDNSNLTEQLLRLKTEHNNQMALLLEKQRVEQEKIQEMFMMQQKKLIEEMERSYPLELEDQELVPPRETLLQENVSSRKTSRRSKDNLASFLSVESLSANESNKENVEFDGLNQSLPHLIISDGDLEILPHSNDFETSNVQDQLTRSLDSSSHISKLVSTFSEEVCNSQTDNKLSPRTYKTALNIPATHHDDATSERNLQNSVNSGRSVENYRVHHRSYETLVIHSPRENANVSSRIESCSFDTSHSSLGKVRHSPRNSARSGEDCARYDNIQRTYDTLHPSICVPPQSNLQPVTRPSKQEQLAASKIVAAAKGYLVRRLMKTELVQNMITTIAETLKTAIELRDEIQSLGDIVMAQADLDLRERLHNQLESEHQSLYALFLYSSPAHRIAVIASDRERIKSQATRPSSGQRPLSSATQRCLKRKQEPDQRASTPPSSRRSARRPLWETRQRSCSGQPAPNWVANPRPMQAKPLPRKPWR